MWAQKITAHELSGSKQDTNLRLSGPASCVILRSTFDLLLRVFLPCKTYRNFCPLQFPHFIRTNWWHFATITGRQVALSEKSHPIKVKPRWYLSALFVQLLVCLHCAHPCLACWRHSRYPITPTDPLPSSNDFYSQSKLMFSDQPNPSGWNLHPLYTSCAWVLSCTRPAPPNNNPPRGRFLWLRLWRIHPSKANLRSWWGLNRNNRPSAWTVTGVRVLGHGANWAPGNAFMFDKWGHFSWPSQLQRWFKVT